MKQMKRRILLGVCTLFVLLSWVLPVGAVPSVDSSQKVHDLAGVLTTQEISNLEEIAAAYVEEYSMAMVFVTTKDAEGLTTQEYADDFFDYNKFGLSYGDKSQSYTDSSQPAYRDADTEPNGIIFVLDLDNREYYMGTSGFAIRVYDDETIQDIVTRANDALSQEDYYEAMRKTSQTTHTKTADIYRAAARSEEGRQEISDYIDDESAYTQPETLLQRLTRAVRTALLVAFAVSIIVVGVLLGFHKRSLPAPPAADWYLGDGGVKLLDKTDNFTNSYVTRSRLATDTSSGGSGGSGGGFGSGGSSHSSSSGSSHGGGGTKF